MMQPFSKITPDQIQFELGKYLADAYQVLGECILRWHRSSKTVTPPNIDESLLPIYRRIVKGQWKGKLGECYPLLK